MIAVTITNREKTVPLDCRQIRRAVQAVVRDAGILEGRISVAVVDDPTIAKLHDEFLGDPAPTDVLSFVLERSPHLLEGEILLSADTARANAAKYSSTVEEEMLLYVIHGALHLVGYDDAAPRERAVMRRRERVYLARAADHKL